MNEKEPKDVTDRSADAKEAVDDFVRVTCARCGKFGTLQTFMLEEGYKGHEWECHDCWEASCYCE